MESKRKKHVEKWLKNGGWIDIKEKWPESDTEVVIFYVTTDKENTDVFQSELIHEKYIDSINSPIMYWINKPE